MKKLVWFLRFLAVLQAVLFCLLLLFSTESAKAASADASGAMYEYYFPELGLSMSLNAGTTIMRINDELFVKKFQLWDEDFEDGFYVVSLVSAVYFGLEPFQQMDDEALQEFVTKFFGGDTSQLYTKVDDFLPGISAVRAERTDESVYGVHIIARVDDWVVDVVAGRMDGDVSIPDEAITYQEAILRSLMGADSARSAERHITMRNDGRLDFPLKTRSLQLNIPNFTGVSMKNMPTNEREVFAFLGRDNSKILMIDGMLDPNAQGDMILTDLLADDTIQNLAEFFISKIENALHVKGSWERLQLGVERMPVIHVTAENQSYEQYVWLMDCYRLDINLTAVNSSISGAESVALTNMVIEAIDEAVD